MLTRRSVLGAASAACSGLALPPSGSAAETRCTMAEADVLLGGITGFDALGNPAFTSKLRETCRAGLYIHGYIWGRTPLAGQKAILSAFAGLPTDVELGFVNDAWFRNAYVAQFQQVGVRAQHGHVNGFYPKTAPGWPLLVKGARAMGFESVAPIVTPNSGQYASAPFRSPTWDYVRDAAHQGGGLTIDAPPHFFLTQPAGYRQFVMDEITWANDAGLRTTFIVSPQAASPLFLDQTKQVVAMLRRHNATPKAYVVENYNPKDGPTYLNKIGNEDDRDTVTGVALWLAQNANKRA